jgi:hypothetical protein
VADLGGGTLDLSAYEVSNVNPLRLRETAKTRCKLLSPKRRVYVFDTPKQGELQGSSYVSGRAENWLKGVILVVLLVP